jgi:hypothetical protein
VQDLDEFNGALATMLKGLNYEVTRTKQRLFEEQEVDGVLERTPVTQPSY